MAGSPAGPIPAAISVDGSPRLPWHLENLGADGSLTGAHLNIRPAWQVTQGDPNVRVAICDPGILRRPSCLYERVGNGVDFQGGDGSPDLRRRGALHGTACAALAVGNYGVAPDCTVVPIRLVGNHPVDTYIRALYWAAGNCDILLLPWSIPYDQRIADAIAEVAALGRPVAGGALGLPIVCAAMNLGRDVLPFPANLESVLAIGAFTNQGRLAPYSNRGAGLDLLCPSSGGTLPLATAPRLDLGGTSAAAALAAGVIALLLSAVPSLTAADVFEVLLESAVQPENQPAPADQRAPYPWLDAGAALQRLT